MRVAETTLLFRGTQGRLDDPRRVTIGLAPCEMCLPSSYVLNLYLIVVTCEPTRIP